MRKGPAPQPRVSLDPLLVFEASFKALARRLGIERSTLYVYQERGVPVHSADRLAVKLGKHPCEIWDDWYDVA